MSPVLLVTLTAGLRDADDLKVGVGYPGPLVILLAGDLPGPGPKVLGTDAAS